MYLLLSYCFDSYQLLDKVPHLVRSCQRHDYKKCEANFFTNKQMQHRSNNPESIRDRLWRRKLMLGCYVHLQKL